MKGFLASGAGIACAFFALYPLCAETVQLGRGREVEIIDGKVPQQMAEELFHAAADLIKKGNIETARDYWKLLVEKGPGDMPARVRTAQARIAEIERQSFVVLRDGSVVKGKISTALRTDLLGFEGKDDIPSALIKEISAEYHPGYSRVSRTFYPLTLLEVIFRSGEVKHSRITGQIELSVETDGSALKKVVLGKDYEILRPDNLARQIEAMTSDRVIKIVIYPNLDRQ